jgi:hypothetical protein
VQPAYDKAPEPKPSIGGDKDRACDCRGPVAHGEGVDGGVEEDAPAHGHEAQLRDAGEQHAARAQDGDGDDGIARYVELVEDEEGEEEGRDEDGGVLYFGGGEAE